MKRGNVYDEWDQSIGQFESGMEIIWHSKRLDDVLNLILEDPKFKEGHHPGTGLFLHLTDEQFKLLVSIVTQEARNRGLTG